MDVSGRDGLGDEDDVSELGDWSAEWELGPEEDGALLDFGRPRSLWEAALERVPLDEERVAEGV